MMTLTGQLEHDNYDGKNSQEIDARIGQSEQDRTAKTGQSEQGNHSWTGLSNIDSCTVIFPPCSSLYSGGKKITV
jgi:hypothetical protein